ncbi:AAA family ATPase [Gemmatimonadota bacterium]
MQLHRIKLVNFRQHADTEIELGPGITAIVGPNGSGKSTLLEAIAWAFYGNAAARGSRDSIRRHRAPGRSQVRVEVDFSLGAHEFQVSRGMYKAELFQDHQSDPIAVSHQEVSGRLIRALGLNREEFFNTYFTGQKELAVMGAMGSTERSRFLSRILGYDKLKLGQDKLREVRTRRRGELAGLEQGLANEDDLLRERGQAQERAAAAASRAAAIRDAHAAAIRSLEAKGPTWTQMVELRESVLSLDSELRVAERDVQEARREFERLDRELAEALDARSQLHAIAPDLARMVPLTEELERLEREAQAAGRRRALSGQVSEIKEQLGRLARQLDEIGDTASAAKEARGSLGRVREEHRQAEENEEKARTVWIRDKQDAETKRQSLRDQYRDLQKHREGVVNAGPEGICPTCTRPLGANYDSALEALDRQLEEIEIDGKYFARRVDQLSEEPEDVTKAKASATEAARLLELALQEVARCDDRSKERNQAELEQKRTSDRMGELSQEIDSLPEAYDAERHDEVRAEIRVLDPINRRGIELQVKAERAELLVVDAETAEKNLSDREARFERLQRAMADLGYSEQRFTAARAEYELAEAAAREAEVELVSAEADQRAAVAALSLAEQRIHERQERAKSALVVRRDIRVHDELDQALQDLRAELNASMRPELVERASGFLSDLTGGRYGQLELDEQYRSLIIEDGVPKLVVSGGEEDLVNLVLRLAIGQMVAERAGQPLSLLVLDEIFGSLDENRRGLVVDLLHSLGGRFPQVVLITHIESVVDGVDRVLRVDYDQRRGAATVTEDGGALVL